MRVLTVKRKCRKCGRHKLMKDKKKYLKKEEEEERRERKNRSSNGFTGVYTTARR